MKTPSNKSSVYFQTSSEKGKPGQGTPTRIAGRDQPEQDPEFSIPAKEWNWPYFHADMEFESPDHFHRVLEKDIPAHRNAPDGVGHLQEGKRTLDIMAFKTMQAQVAKDCNAKEVLLLRKLREIDERYEQSGREICDQPGIRA